MKRCSKCGVDKFSHEFYRDKSRKGGLCYVCVACTLAHQAAYHRTPSGRSVSRKATAKYQRTEGGAAYHRKMARIDKIKHPTHYAARNASRYAAATGTILRPTACSRCGGTGKIEGHHADYNQPLDVVWLCHRCHLELHRLLKGS